MNSVRSAADCRTTGGSNAEGNNGTVPGVQRRNVSRHENFSKGPLVEKEIPCPQQQQQQHLPALPPQAAQHHRSTYAATDSESYSPPDFYTDHHHHQNTDQQEHRAPASYSQGSMETTSSKPPKLEILHADLHTLDPPSFGHYRMLLACLLLTTALAVASALDARLQCVSHELYYLLELFDDDTIEVDEAMVSLAEENSDCVDMFRRVMLPVGGATLFLGTMAHNFIHSHIKSITALPNHLRPSHLAASLKLLVLLVGIQAVWTYGIFEIMLRPKLDSVENGKNPYNSLAAVDQMGHVGDNANLYYLSWISESIIMALVYQVLFDCFRWCRQGFQHQPKQQHAPDNTLHGSSSQQPSSTTVAMMNAASSRSDPEHHHRHQLQQQYQRHLLLDAIITRDLEGGHDNLKIMLSYTSARKLQFLYNQRRKTWYEFMIRLRMRSGFWVAALCSTVVVFTSSALLFHSILMSQAIQIMGYADHSSFEDANQENATQIAYRDVCTILKTGTREQNNNGDVDLPKELCLRTSLSVLAGGIAACMCIAAIVLHLIVRRQAAKDMDLHCGGAFALHILQATAIPTGAHTPLWCELSFSLCLSVLLGLNAVFATGVQGPASTVGNLYYASWLAFLLCLRIFLGCVEELYEIETHGEAFPVNRQPLQNRNEKNCVDGTDSLSSVPRSSGIHGSEATDMVANVRPGRLRKYCFLAMFSTICSASAWDAACNQDSELTMHQKYMILAPSVVAVLSTLLFLLCLKSKTYEIVCRFACGGILSIVCFAIWLADLLTTMHSPDSWAVNAIGEIKMANLYYFSWAAIITAGVQMVSFLKDIFGRKEKSIMLIVWASISKVCFVILGASLHIWSKIADKCSNVNILQGWSETTYCSRTFFAIVVAVTGILLGWLVVFSRVAHCRLCTHRIRIHAEAAISMFLVLLFGAAVALVTSIGGPGQTVGDLYYSTWLAFFVAIGIFVSCFDQIKQEEADANDVIGVEYVDIQYSSAEVGS
jgi:hypothetical protein